MCGRYAVTRAVGDLLPDLLAGHGVARDDYNVAPTALVPVVRQRHGERGVPEVRWGFLPSWAKDVKARPQPINARIETVATAGMFRRAFAQARCVVPALGYYEWSVTANGKQPHFVFRPGGALAMAGVLSAWADPARAPDDPERWRLSMAVVTRDAHVAPGEVHDRMPACLTPEGVDAWLDDTLGSDRLLTLLDRESEEVAHALEHHEVSREVGDPRNTGPHLIEPLPTPA